VENNDTNKLPPEGQLDEAIAHETIVTYEDLSRSPGLWPAVGKAAQLAVVAMLGAIVLFAFANTLHNSGFALDNKFIILEDPRLRDAKQENIRLIFTQDYWWPKAVSGLYRPLVTLSYLFNYSILGNGDNAAGYHWINFVLHWLNAVLVYLLVLVLMKKLWPAFFVAAIFAVHPIVVESVSNLVGRADLLATATVLAGFLFYARATVVEDAPETKPGAAIFFGGLSLLLIGFVGWQGMFPATVPKSLQGSTYIILALSTLGITTLGFAAAMSSLRRVPYLFLMMLITLIGVFCKESAVVVLGVIGLYDFTYRLETKHGNWFTNLVASFWGFLVKGYVALIPPFLALWFVRSSVFEKLRPPELPFVDNPLVSADFWTGRATAIKVVGKYFWLLIWPKTLSCDYSYNQVPMVNWRFNTFEDVKAIVALVTLLVVIWIAIRNFKRNKAVFFFIMFFIGTFLPTSNLLRIIGSIMAERFMYLPSIGFAGCLVIAVYAICRQLVPQLDISSWAQRIWLQVVARTALGLIVLACGVRTFLRNFDWEDDITLWSQAVQVCPDSFKTHKSLAFALYEKDPEGKMIDRIIDEGEKALKVTDKTQIVLLHLGAYYRIKGDLLAQRAPDGSLIPSQASLPWYQKSVDVLTRAIPLDHGFNDDNRAKEFKRGRKAEDIPDIGNHEIYWNLGLSYMRLGQFQGALNSYLYMRHLSPTNPDAYLSIASVFIAAGKAEEAAISLLQALLLDSNRQEAMRLLIEIYRQIDKQGCSVVYAPSQPQPRLNAECPLVRNHICSAYAGLVQVFIEAKQYNLAQDTVKNALKSYPCPREVFDQLSNTIPASKRNP
jgi:protein O-mannosyl-transferase